MELEGLRQAHDRSINDFIVPDRFDACPQQVQDPMYFGPDSYFDPNALEFNSDYFRSLEADSL